jgi:hypothetical protein
MARKSAAKHGRKKLAQPPKRPQENSWAVIGIDLSLTSLSGALMFYDAILDKLKGPILQSERFERSVHFLDRLAVVSRAENFIHSLMSEANCVGLDLNQVWIGVEEPWPAGIVKKAESGWLRQQAEIVGAFMGGLSRYGFVNVYEVNNSSWKNAIKEEVGHWPDKWDVKSWAIDAYGVPDLPDLIKTSRGLMPQPEKSKAKPQQPDDTYDACGVMAWMEQEHETISP